MPVQTISSRRVVAGRFPGAGPRPAAIDDDEHRHQHHDQQEEKRGHRQQEENRPSTNFAPEAAGGGSQNDPPSWHRGSQADTSIGLQQVVQATSWRSCGRGPAFFSAYPRRQNTSNTPPRTDCGQPAADLHAMEGGRAVAAGWSRHNESNRAGPGRRPCRPCPRRFRPAPAAASAARSVTPPR